MSSASPKVLTHSAKVRAIRDFLYFQAAEAREDPGKFIEFAMRDYSRGAARIKLAAHQSLGLEFLEAHPRALLLWPPGFSKTFLIAGKLLWELGTDPTHRIGIFGASMDQASRVLDVFRMNIEQNPFVRLVFPKLRPSQRPGDPWTSTDLVIDRPANIADKTVSAFGLHTNRPLGKRFSRVYADDVVTFDNTLTKEMRDKDKARMELVAFSRLDPNGARVIFANNPWHPEDMTHELMKNGWPMLRYDAYGDIEIHDDRSRLELDLDEWDSDLIRRKYPDGSNSIVRLIAHDPDPQNEKLLWPEKFGHAELDAKKATHPGTFDQLFRSIVRDDETAMCKREYIEKCKDNAIANKFFSMVQRWEKGDGFVFTGVDLAFGQGEEHDDTAIVTIAVIPALRNMRLILDVQVGKWPSPETLKRIEQVNKAYLPDAIVIENNGAQRMLREFGLSKDLGLPLRPYTTTAKKAHPDFGIPQLFWEFDNGAWAFPCDKHGTPHKNVQRIIDACLNYTGAKHVDDPLMALFFAHDQAKKWGAFGEGPKQPGGGSLSDVMSR